MFTKASFQPLKVRSFRCPCASFAMDRVVRERLRCLVAVLSKKLSTPVRPVPTPASRRASHPQHRGQTMPIIEPHEMRWP